MSTSPAPAVAPGGRTPDASTSSAVTTTGLSFAVGGVSIVASVDLDVTAGELLGVIGPNGAGKTTLFNLLSGLYEPTAGRIQLLGQDVTSWSIERRARAGLGRTFQTSSVFPGLSVLENVRIAAQAHLGGSLRVWLRAARSPRASATASDCVGRVGLAARAQEPAAALSHGDKRKLELAVLLATEPSVMLLDEPMAGVSAEEIPGLSDLIAAVHRERGITVVMVEHHVDVVLGLADRIAVMHHGALLACAEPAAVMADPTVKSAYLGEPL